MSLIGTAPLYNSSEITPPEISIVPKVAQHKAKVKRQKKNPAATKIIANAAIIAQLYTGICEQASFISVLKSAAYTFTISTVWPTLSGSATFCVLYAGYCLKLSGFSI